MNELSNTATEICNLGAQMHNECQGNDSVNTLLMVNLYHALKAEMTELAERLGISDGIESERARIRAEVEKLQSENAIYRFNPIAAKLMDTMTAISLLRNWIKLHCYDCGKPNTDICYIDDRLAEIEESLQ